jgi:hypothetical protein
MANDTPAYIPPDPIYPVGQTTGRVALAPASTGQIQPTAYERGQGIANTVGKARDAITTPIVDNMMDQRQSAIGANNFMRGLFGMEANDATQMKVPPQIDPPTKAQTAAGDATTKALQSAPDLAPPPKIGAGDVQPWNNHIGSLVSSVSGYPTGQVNAALNMPLPDMNKAAGVAALQGGSNLVPLNAGYGTRLFAGGATNGQGQSGTNGVNAGPTRRNDFSGIGGGEMPAGAAGVFGPSGLPPGAAGAAGGAAASPFDQVQSQVMDWMRQSQQALSRGDGIGARRIASNAQRFAQLFSTIGEQPYRMGSLDVQRGHLDVANKQLSLQAQEKQPGMAMDQAALQDIIAGRPDKAGVKKRAFAGQNLYPSTAVPAYSWQTDPNAPPGTPAIWRGIPPPQAAK